MVRPNLYKSVVSFYFCYLFCFSVIFFPLFLQSIFLFHWFFTSLFFKYFQTLIFLKILFSTNVFQTSTIHLPLVYGVTCPIVKAMIFLLYVNLSFQVSKYDFLLSTIYVFKACFYNFTPWILIMVIPTYPSTTLFLFSILKPLFNKNDQVQATL